MRQNIIQCIILFFILLKIGSRGIENKMVLMALIVLIRFWLSRSGVLGLLMLPIQVIMG